MPLTLEERERLAYVTNSPDHPALARALDARDEADDELRHELEHAKRENRGLESENTRLQEDIEAAETKYEKLRERMNEAMAHA